MRFSNNKGEEKNSLAATTTTNTTQKYQKRTKLVPPDGGWGWMVILGTAICNIFNQSMLSLFSLLYGDALEAMGHNTSGAAIVLSTMLFVTNFGGPIAGAIVKLSSPRVVAVTGAVSCTAGIYLSGFATNIWHLVLTYGLLLGLGLGFIQNSSFVAINAYFVLRKSRAVGLANVGTGVGQTLMPHLVRYLLERYGFKGACLLLSGLSLNGIAGTLLIQPVEWHMKKVEELVVVDETLHLLDEKKNDDLKKTFSENGIKKAKNLPSAAQKKSLWKKLYDLFDISLLSSPRFLNVLIGTALATTSIQNFSMLFPFFLQKAAGLDKHQTAICMSAVAGADIVGRLVLPIFQDKFKIKARWMLIMTCTWLTVVRQILAYQSSYVALIIMSLLYGVGRSMIIVARNIAISENCRLDQVPAAVGLGMLTMGIIVPPAGYFLGWIRDYTGSYIVCITAQNLLLVVVLVTWIPDMLLVYIMERKERKAQEKNADLQLT